MFYVIYVECDTLYAVLQRSQGGIKWRVFLCILKIIIYKFKSPILIFVLDGDLFFLLVFHRKKGIDRIVLRPGYVLVDHVEIIFFAMLVLWYTTLVYFWHIY